LRKAAATIQRTDGRSKADFGFGACYPLYLWVNGAAIEPTVVTSGGYAMRKQTATATALGCVVMVAASISARADEIKVMSSNALKTVFEQLAPEFEKATHHKLVFTFGAGVPLKAAIEKDVGFDVAVLTTFAIDDLIKQGRLYGTSRTIIAYANAGVAVRKGAAKPDIGTVEAFKRALLAAKSIAIVEQGGTGIYLKALLPRLGIADAVKAKIKYLPPENPAANAVANGEAEIGMTMISEILPYAGAELVGPLPKEIHLTDAFAIAMSTDSRRSEEVGALIRFLTAPAAASAYKAKGLDPVGG
jgi:molybdate transport system substrate-binding protein